MKATYSYVGFLGLICSVSAFNKITEIFLAKSVEIKSWAEEYLAYNDLVAAPTPDYPYWNFIPDYQASVIPGGATVSWESKCFKNNRATASKSDDGTKLNIKITSTNPLVEGDCNDNYILLTIAAMQTWAPVSKGKLPKPVVETEFTLDLPADISEAEWWDIDTKGVRICRFFHDRLEVISNILQTAVMFGGEATLGISDTVAAANIDFLQKYTNIESIEPRDDSLNVPPPASEVHSGDAFYLMRFDGLNPMLAWAMGSTTGHVTTAIWIDGELYVCESTTDSAYWPTDYIQKTPYEQWLTQVNAADFQVVWAPLSDEARSKYNETAAVEFFKSVEGLDYGYMTMLWGWIDTPKDNFPCLPTTYTNCLQWELLEPLLAHIDRMIPEIGDLMWNPAYSQRLGVPAPGMRTSELFKEAHNQGMASVDVIQIPENDNWRYNMTRYDEPAVGHNMVCCVFVCNTWKEAGVFGDLADSINCGELTNWDDYVLTIHADTYQQIVGTYSLKLNNFNTKDPYAHMAETCPSLPPNYEKPANC